MGETVREPFNDTLPMPWSILTLSALVVVHVSVDDSPSLIEGGSAKNVTSGGGIVLFFLISMVMEAPGIPLKNTIKRFLDFSEISFSKTVSLPTRKLIIEIGLLLRKRNPPLIFLSGVFFVIIMSPSPGSSTLK